MRAPPSSLPGPPGMIGLDTNVLLRTFIGDGDPHEPAAIAVFQGLSKAEPGFITQATLVEFYWMLRRGYRRSKAECLNIINRLAMSPVIEFDDGEGVIRALLLAEDGTDFPDALIHTTFEQFQCAEAVTFDRKAAEHLGWRLIGGSEAA